ncbi:MAG: lytic transglycosylase domain-containing protein [Geobacter sp.]|nr:lytic transglycosylase domain-containing protein [Geobacter sp.]
MNIRRFLLVAIFLAVASRSHAFCFQEAGEKYGISPLLLESIARTESGLKVSAVGVNVNGSRDLGLMQINSSWIRPLGLDPERLVTDACYNTEVGARILRECIDRKGYTWEAVGCYNAVTRSKQIKYSRRVYNALKKAAAALATAKRQEAQQQVARRGEPVPPELSFAVSDAFNEPQELHQ